MSNEESVDMTKEEYLTIRDDLLHQWSTCKITDHQVDVGLNAIGAFDDDESEQSSNKSGVEE